MGGEFDVISRSLFFLSSAYLRLILGCLDKAEIQHQSTILLPHFHTITQKNVSNTCLYQKKAVILQANDRQKYSCPTPY